MAQSREEKNRKQREHRRRTGNIDTYKYEKTPQGFLMRKYRNMESRVRGIQKSKTHLYPNLYLLPRKEFYTWSKNSTEFEELYNHWVNNNYDRKLTPSVDRVDSSKGYELNNMEWVTHSENSRRGAISQKRKKKI